MYKVKLLDAYTDQYLISLKICLLVDPNGDPPNQYLMKLSLIKVIFSFMGFNMFLHVY